MQKLQQELPMDLQMQPTHLHVFCVFFVFLLLDCLIVPIIKIQQIITVQNAMLKLELIYHLKHQVDFCVMNLLILVVFTAVVALIVVKEMKMTITIAAVTVMEIVTVLVSIVETVVEDSIVVFSTHCSK
ncbi:hypothetical protein PVAND_017092 [Polypedilum vanderplanki]|uniref:Transmembrane protein n=1 Tax=Polypedilum vanderplanki TaxID=319348 RepID=A0A9J6BI13_POLVA|nr:hypothetical protein PVAND_017092 [Polypedilum vanderplanki]